MDTQLPSMNPLSSSHLPVTWADVQIPSSCGSGGVSSTSALGRGLVNSTCTGATAHEDHNSEAKTGIRSTSHVVTRPALVRDLFCLLPEWPRHRVLELCPARWKETLEDQLAQQRLAADPFRQITLGAFDAQLDQA